MSTSYMGKATSRVDGLAKVTGRARYAAEYRGDNLAYGVVVSSEIAKGVIQGIETGETMAVPGVLRVFTHEDAPRLAESDKDWQDEIAPGGSPFRPLQDERIRFSGQPVALAVAETFEIARYASRLVRVTYQREPHVTGLADALPRAFQPKTDDGQPVTPDPRGDFEHAFAAAAVRLEAEYHLPAEHHNPMETFAATVLVSDDGKLSVYDKTQGVQNVRDYLVKVFQLSDDDLTVLSPFVGGAFGLGLRPQYPVVLAVLAARELKRSVRVTLTRQQMFSLGYRPAVHQRVSLGATADGLLQAIQHKVIGETSQFEEHRETTVDWSGVLYQCDHVGFDYRLARLDLNTPLDMRAPGAAWGVHALECAMDELATKLGIDPLELRLKNYSQRDQNEDRPFSSKELKECYRQGADKFGWARRDPHVRSMRVGHELVGWGVATGIWPAEQEPAAARAVLAMDGTLTVTSATSDIGTGTRTIMTQIAADTLGLPLESVTFLLADSSLPQAPVEGGSMTASTVGSAMKAVCEQVRNKLFERASKVDGSPVGGLKLPDVVFVDGEIRSREDAARRISIVAALQHGGGGAIDERVSVEGSPDRKQFSCYAHSAVFAEVKVDDNFGTIEVSRIVSAIAGGRVINPMTARSQIMGGIVWGISMALREESVLDHHFGRFMNHNLAEYHIPVNADIHDIDVLFVAEQDDVVNPLGAKGLGEIGVVGTAAAITNAVYHATGKRIRDLPIIPERLVIDPLSQPTAPAVIRHQRS